MARPRTYRQVDGKTIDVVGFHTATIRFHICDRRGTQVYFTTWREASNATPPGASSTAREPSTAMTAATRRRPGG